MCLKSALSRPRLPTPLPQTSQEKKQTKNSSLVPRPFRFCSSVRVQYNTWKCSNNIKIKGELYHCWNVQCYCFQNLLSNFIALSPSPSYPLTLFNCSALICTSVHYTEHKPKNKNGSGLGTMLHQYLFAHIQRRNNSKACFVLFQTAYWSKFIRYLYCWYQALLHAL